MTKYTLESLSKEIIKENYGMFKKRGNKAIGKTLLNYLLSIEYWDDDKNFSPYSIIDMFDFYSDSESSDSESSDSESSDSDSEYDYEECTDTAVREEIWEMYEFYAPIVKKLMYSKERQNERCKAIKEELFAVCGQPAWLFEHCMSPDERTEAGVYTKEALDVAKEAMALNFRIQSNPLKPCNKAASQECRACHKKFFK